MTSPKSHPGSGASDKDAHALLARLRCPTPLHALRTLLLGHNASPRLEASPMATLAQAWGGELPEFASDAEVEEVKQVLMHGLWNRLTEHQSTRNPFRLPCFEVTATRLPVMTWLACALRSSRVLSKDYSAPTTRCCCRKRRMKR